MILIGMCGLARTGKDTVSDFLVKKHGFKKLSFALYVKDVAELAGWDGRKDERGRRLLQRLGDVMREYDQDCVTKNLGARIEIYNQVCFPVGREPRVVVSDVRLLSEVEWIRTNGGSVWLILRNTDRASVPEHSTEKADTFDRSLFDVVLENNADFEALYSGVDMVVKRAVKNVR